MSEKRKFGVILEAVIEVEANEGDKWFDLIAKKVDVLIPGAIVAEVYAPGFKPLRD